MKRTFNLLVLILLVALALGAHGVKSAKAAGTGKVYVYAKYCGYDTPYFAVYDVATDTWTDLNTYSTCAMMAVSRNGTLFAYGESSGSIDVYNPGTDAWSFYRSAPPITPGDWDWGNLEITKDGVFLYTQENHNTLYYAVGAGGSWNSVSLSFTPNMQGDYDPISNQYVVGEQDSTNAHMIDVNTFAVTDFISPPGDSGENKTFAVVMGGRYYYQAYAEPIRSLNLSNPADPAQTHGAALGSAYFLDGAADRMSNTIYVKDQVGGTGGFYYFDPSSGVYSPLTNYTNLFYPAIVYAPAFDLSGNLLVNPSFDQTAQYPRAWAYSVPRTLFASLLDCAYFISPDCSLKLVASRRTSIVTQTVSHTGYGGDSFAYGLSSAANNVPAGGTYRVEISLFNRFNRVMLTQYLTFSDGTHDWESLYDFFNAPADFNKMRFRFFFQKSGGTAWFDNAFLIPSGP